MPECRRCKRDLPSAEVRRTSLGFVCKEFGELGDHSRCARIERAAHAADKLVEARAAVRQAQAELFEARAALRRAA